MIARAAAAIAAVAAAALIVALGRQNADLRARYDALRLQVQVAQPGYTVPTFRTATLDGDTLRLGEADAGRHQLLFVLRADCPFCQASVPAWNRVANELERTSGDAVQALAVSQSSLPETETFVAEYGLESPVSRFTDPKLVRLYRVGSVPLIMLLDETGRVRYSRLGLLPIESELAMDSVLTGVTEILAAPTVSDTPVGGG